MSRLPVPTGQKRKQPESSSAQLTEQELLVYSVIQSRTDTGIWSRDLKHLSKLPENVVTKSVKSLQGKSLIKEVATVQKGRKHFMAVEFEPSKDITGGAWYTKGVLDTEFINLVKDQCARLIYKQRVATLDGVFDAIRRSGIFNVELTAAQIEEIVRALVLDDEVVELKSDGMGDFGSIPVGKVCYKCTAKKTQGEPRVGALASTPCGVCPVMKHCTPDGIISPKTCKGATRRWAKDGYRQTLYDTGGEKNTIIDELSAVVRHEVRSTGLELQKRMEGISYSIQLPKLIYGISQS